MSPKTRVSFPHAFPAAGVVGLSLRDYFAAACLPALNDTHDPPEVTAIAAYRMADAMLAERGVK